MGVSGILNLERPAQWKRFFVGAFCLTAQWLSSSFGTPIVPNLSPLEFKVAGVLVGMGTRLGNGCTSGHGVCGLGGLRTRSIFAVLTFLSTGILTATLVGSSKTGTVTEATISPVLGAAVTALAVGWGPIAAILSGSPVVQKLQSDKKIPAAIGSASLFSAGLYVAGMVHTSKVTGFLNVLGSPYDPTLLTVLGAAVVLSFLSYQYKGSKPVCTDGFCLPTSTQVDTKMLLGAALFGTGWGYAGLCPGPALFASAAGSVPIATLWLPSFFIGSYLGSQLEKQWKSS